MRTLPALALTLSLALGACTGGTEVTTTQSDPTAEQPDAGTDDAAAAAGGAVTFVGTDTVTWESATASTAAGGNELTLTCGEAVPHGLAIEGVQGGAQLAACGETATVELAAGDYTFFCTVPGHREAGMEGTLTVG